MHFESIRQTVVDTCLALADKGYLAGTGGNVAIRADDRHFAVTPSAIDYYAMHAADVCLLHLDTLEQIDGEHPASVESGMHARVLRARPDCRASVHTHQPIASSYTLLAKPLWVTKPDWQEDLGKHVPRVGYAPSGTGLLAWRVGRAFGPDVHACLMRNHGVVFVGRDTAEAMRRVDLLEAACMDFFEQRIKTQGGHMDPGTRALLGSVLNAASRPVQGESSV